jgi:hypothetical protein
MGIYARYNGEWYTVGVPQNPDIIPGLGGWATLSSVSMQGGMPATNTYTQNGVEFTSYTFTKDGTFTLSEAGLIEVLVVGSASMESNGSGGKGGGVITGVEEMELGQSTVAIAPGGTTNGEPTYITEPSGNGGMDTSGNGVFSSIETGRPLGYGGGAAATVDYGQGLPPRPNSGGASTKTSPSGGVTYGAGGIVIIRVPSSKTLAVSMSLAEPQERAMPWRADDDPDGTNV